MLADVRELIKRSRAVGYGMLSRLFDEHQVGLVAQICLDIDLCMEQRQLEESAMKRRIHQKIARLSELQNIIDESRNFCRYVITSRKDFVEILPVSQLPSVKAGFPSTSEYSDIENFVDKCVEAVEENLAHAVATTIARFRSTLTVAEARLLHTQLEVDKLDIRENSNKRQLRISLEFSEAVIREIKRIIDYFVSIQSFLPPLLPNNL